MKKNYLMMAFLFALLGVGQAHAATLTEDFESVALTDADGVELTSTWNYGYGLTNGWKIIGGQIYTSAGSIDYGLWKGVGYNDSNTCLEASYGSSNSAYVAIPTRLTGVVSFYAAGVATSVDGKITVYELEADGDSYTKKETPLATFTPVKYNNSSKVYTWGKCEVDLGTEGKLIGIEMVRSALDDFSATIYEEGAEVKAVNLTAFTTTTPTLGTDAEGKYAAAFTATVANVGNVALTAADGVTVSLLDAGGNVLATSEPVELAVEESKTVDFSYNGVATADGAVTFYAKENFSGNQFAEGAAVTITLAGPRFAIDPAGGHDFGVVAKGATARAIYTIVNSGNVDMNTSVTAPEGFTANVTALVDAGMIGELSVNMNTETAGVKSGTVVLTTDAIDVKSYEIPVSGFVYDPDYFFEDFAAGTLPEGWTTTGSGWSIADGVAKGAYNYSEKSYLTTPALRVATGEELFFQVHPTGNYVTVNITMSKDGGPFEKLKSVYFETASAAFQPVVISGLEPGSYKFCFESDDYEIDNLNGFHLDIAAPELAVLLGEEPVATGAVADFGTVKEQPAAKTYTVSNTGTGTLELTIATSDATQFTVSETAMSLATGESKTFDLALVFDENYGQKEADITITPSYDPTAAVIIHAKAVISNPNVWAEDFEGGAIPEGWMNEGWTVDINDDANGTMMAMIASRTQGQLTTPRLVATAGDKLTFDAYYPWNDEALLVEYSNDERATWNVISNYKPEDDGQPGEISKTIEFTAPADGRYYIRLTANYASVDNFEGFMLYNLEHELAITAQNLPAECRQYDEYTATVTVKELANKEEPVTATLYVAGEAVATAEQVIAANGEATLTLTFIPTELADQAEAYVKVTYAGGELTTESVLLTVTPPFALDETVAPGELEATTYGAIIVNYNAAAGWNTIALPFHVNDVKAVFGDNVKAYKFSNYGFNTMMFEEVTALEAGTPFVLHNTSDINGPLTFQHVEIPDYARTEQYVTKSNITFRTTYSPLNGSLIEGKYLLKENGELLQATAADALNGYRGYFEFPANIDLSKLTFAFTNSDGTVVTGIDDFTVSFEDEGVVYDLQGRRIPASSQLPKGVYIQNGKKIRK